MKCVCMVKFRELANKLNVCIADLFRNIYTINLGDVSFLLLIGLKQIFSSGELSTI